QHRRGLGDHGGTEPGGGEGGERVGDQRAAGQERRRLRLAEPAAGAARENASAGHCSGSVKLAGGGQMATIGTRERRALTPLEDARKLVLAAARPLASEEVALAAALGRTLAADVASADDVPGFDNSAMDGYAVRAADLAGAGEAEPVGLRLVDESSAGSPAGIELGAGEAIRISTG